MRKKSFARADARVARMARTRFGRVLALARSFFLTLTLLGSGRPIPYLARALL
jgi:hypothetical protein